MRSVISITPHVRKRAPGAILACAAALTAAPHIGAQCLAAAAGASYTFAPAPHVVFETDFSGDAGPRPPRGVRFADGALILADHNGRRAIQASDRSAIVVPLTASLGDRYSIEVGFVHRESKGVGAATIAVYGGTRPIRPDPPVTKVEIAPRYWWTSGGGATGEGDFGWDDAEPCYGAASTMKLQGDGADVAVYVDDRFVTYLSDVRFKPTSGIVIELEGRGGTENHVYLTSIRIAGSAPVAVASTPMNPPSAEVPQIPVTKDAGESATQPAGTPTPAATPVPTPTPVDPVSTPPAGSAGPPAGSSDGASTPPASGSTFVVQDTIAATWVLSRNWYSPDPLVASCKKVNFKEVCTWDTPRTWQADFTSAAVDKPMDCGAGASPVSGGGETKFVDGRWVLRLPFDGYLARAGASVYAPTNAPTAPPRSVTGYLVCIRH